MGLDDWDIAHATELGEERLLAAVKRSLSHSVKRLLSPPLPPESDGTPSLLDDSHRVGIPVSPFPTWMLCPSCRLLAPLQSNLFNLKTDRFRYDQNRYIHTNCSKGKYPPTVIPARFLVACKHGHLDDFLGGTSSIGVAIVSREHCGCMSMVCLVLRLILRSNVIAVVHSGGCLMPLANRAKRICPSVAVATFTYGILMKAVVTSRWLAFCWGHPIAGFPLLSLPSPSQRRSIS